MSKKSKVVGFDSTAPYGIGAYEDTKARLKHQTLLQDYEDLQKETDAARSKLEVARQRKLILAAEVRFLRRRYKYLVNTKNTNSSYEQNLIQTPNLIKQTRVSKEQLLTRKEVSQYRSPPLASESKSKKKNRVVKQVARHDAFPLTDQFHKKVSYGGKEISPLVTDLNHKMRKEFPAPNATPVLERSQKERIIGEKDANTRNLAAAFDLNQATTPTGKEAPLPTRAPIFDLNEISTGDEDFQGNVESMKFEEAKMSLLRGINEDQQSDLKLSICRNSGESSSSRAGKRKISWQDPVALRV